MNDNVYEPPKASLSVNAAPGPDGDFYVVSIRKFVALYIATMGLYAIYWFYRNWSLYRQSTGAKIWPVPRGLFHIFFIHALFRLVEARILAAGKTINWKGSSEATLLVVCILASNALDRMALREVGSPYTDWLSLIMLVPLTILLCNAQLAVNLACNDPDGTGNDNFTPANYVWFALGAGFWGFSMYGLFAP